MLEITFVGTGDAFGSGGRRHTAILARGASQGLLLDCGPTTMTGLKALGIDPREIDAVAVTHFHGDHIGGLPSLLLDCIYESRRRKPLSIYGPPGIRQRVEAIARCFEYPVESAEYPLRYVEFRTGVPFEAAGFRVTPLPAHHAPVTCPHMLRVESETRSLVFSGDTGWHDELPARVGDVDLFICECVYVEEGKYELHMALRQLERHRHQFRCGDICLTHLGSEVLADLDRVPFATASDGLRIKL
jgi:ribonuclease BN (tRNA processing enzyme)